MFSRVPKDLKLLQKSNVSINEVLHYYYESRNRKRKLQAKKIWINKRQEMRKKAQLDKENQHELEAAFNRNLKKLRKKKEQLKEEKEFQKKKEKYTKLYEQKQIDDLKPGKRIKYINSKARDWREKNNKTKKSPLSQERHQSTNALTVQERARLIEESLREYKGGKRRTKKRRRKKKKRKTQRRRKRSRKRRKTRRKRAGNSTFIKESKINEGIQGCNTLLHSISEVHKCRNMGGLKNYKKKKMLLGKIHLPRFNRPHLPHMKTSTEKHNDILANMDWDDWRKNNNK
jgi:hypothetical protein